MPELVHHPDPLLRPRYIGRLWAGLLGPPVLWLAHFQINYTLVAWVCAHGHRSLLAAVSIATLLALAALGVLAWSNWRMAGVQLPGERNDTAARSRFLALLGLLASGLFFLVTAAQAAAQVFIDPCWQ
jgi:hypothetical protein